MKIPIAKDGYRFIKLSLIFGISFYILGTKFWFFYLLSVICLLFSVLFIYFFRDPERKILFDETKILSPADGKIISIDEVVANGVKQSNIIKIFLSPFDVHIQRSPVSGKIVSIEYKPGKFLQAFKSDAATVNEQNIINLQLTTYDLRLTIKQIAGIIARRIICLVKPLDEVIQGDRLGMILLGSQVEIELLGKAELKVKIGDRVKAGLTVIAEI